VATAKALLKCAKNRTNCFGRLKDMGSHGQWRFRMNYITLQHSYFDYSKRVITAITYHYCFYYAL